MHSEVLQFQLEVLFKIFIKINTDVSASPEEDYSTVTVAETSAFDEDF